MKRFSPRLWTLVILLITLTGVYVYADNTPEEEQYYSFNKDAVPPHASLGHARIIAGTDGTLIRWIRTSPSGHIIVDGGGGAGPEGVPQPPVAVVCPPTGTGNFTANAADLRLEIRNNDTFFDVGVLWGALTGATLLTPIGYSVRMGADAGSGDSSLYVTPSGLRVGGESFACYSGGTAVLTVIAWRAE